MNKLVAQVLFHSMRVLHSLCFVEATSVLLQGYLTSFRDLILTPSGLGLQPYSFERMLHRIKHPLPLLLAA